MKDCKVEALIYYSKLTLDSEHLAKRSGEEIQQKLDEYMAKGYRLVSTTSTNFGFAIYIYLFFEKDVQLSFPHTMQQAVDFDLRPWTMNDLGSLVSYANNPRIAQNMTDKFPHPYTETDGLSFIEFATSDSSAHIFAIDVVGEAVGGIGVHPQPDIHRKNAELGYWLAEPFWGKGIISAAIKRAVDIAFGTYDIDRIFARPFGTNVASQRVLQKNGFVLEGHFRGTLYKNGEYLDELIYALRRQNWKPD